jgi:small-conductance mechanosensitive channel
MNDSIKKILHSIIILLFFTGIAHICRKLINNIANKQKDQPNIEKKTIKNADILYQQIATIIFYFIIFVGISVILPMNGIGSHTTIAILGTIGLGIGLSCQGVLSNIWCGIVIIMNDIYKINDVVEVKISSISNDTKDIIIGKVKYVNLFYTKLADIDTNREISIPNTTMYNNSVITNNSIIYS